MTKTKDQKWEKRFMCSNFTKGMSIDTGCEIMSFIEEEIAKAREEKRDEIEKILSKVTQQVFDMAIGDSEDFERGFKQGFEVCWNKMLDSIEK